MAVKDGKQCEELYQRYIHDFVYTVHKCTHKTKDIMEKEYQVYILELSNTFCCFLQNVLSLNHIVNSGLSTQNSCEDLFSGWQWDISQ